MNNQLQQDLILRRNRLQKAMQDQNMDACILSTGVNVYYMTGMIYNGYYYQSADGDIFHFVKRPDVGLENKISIRKPEQITEELRKRGLAIPKTLLLETDVVTMSECMRLMSIFDIQSPANASALMRRIRSIKTDFELSQTKACARKHEAVYAQVADLYHRGMTDVELQIEIERTMRLHGSMGIFRSFGANMDIYMGSLLSGSNAEAASPFDFALGGAGTNPMMPLGSCGRRIEEGETIMVDMAGNYSPWMTDMTRVFSVGKTSNLAYKAHQVSLDIQDKVIHLAKPGVACSELYNSAMELVIRNNLDAYFMGTELQAKFIGHGVGLEINEPPVFTPRSRELLEPNMIFALEPKFVIPKTGAVGIENTFVVTETGTEKITTFVENIIKL